MPIYEYECQKCGHHLEKRQSINDKPLTRCPICKGKLEKQWSQTSFQLKGSGWYVTDYASKKSEGKAEGDAKAETKTDQAAASDAGEKSKPAEEKKSSESAKPATSETKTKAKKSSGKSAD